jgi:hypothetical protein
MPSKITTKSELGQFFTTNYQYILQNLHIPVYVENIIEPFAGNCDLLKFIPDTSNYIIECYDVDPKKSNVIERDTLKNPPTYDDKFVLTNPPYLARNKSKDKSIFDIYNTNDLYKCFLKGLLETKCMGGIIIIPLNYWCSIRNTDIELRKAFLHSYVILNVNVFEEQVFDDTGYTICAFQFTRREERVLNSSIQFNIYPHKIRMDLELNEFNNYTIGGEIYKLAKQNRYKITRLIKGAKANTNILAKCIDDNINSKISLTMVSDKDIYYDNTPNKSARTYASLVITPELSIMQQEDLVRRFNKYFNEMREKYHSLFLTNYRESNTIARKRIAFDLIYQIVGYLLTTPDI